MLVHRVRGDLLLAGPCRDEVAAEEALSRCIEVARQQDSRSIELRATRSRAQPLAETGLRQKAYDLRAPVHDWFTQGFDTADLEDARALLDQLA